MFYIPQTIFCYPVFALCFENGIKSGKIINFAASHQKYFLGSLNVKRALHAQMPQTTSDTSNNANNAARRCDLSLAQTLTFVPAMRSAKLSVARTKAQATLANCCC